jgi:DNA-binding transcriptional ArsR family regulator
VAGLAILALPTLLLSVDVGVVYLPCGIALPTVLEHVRILEKTRLLTTEKVGRVRECTLGPERLDEARHWIETFQMWDRRLDGLDRYISTRSGRRG